MKDLRGRVRTSWLSVASGAAVTALVLGGTFLVGSGAPAAAGAATAPAPGTVVTLVPSRIADSRIFQWFPTFHAGEEQDLSVVGQGGIPRSGVAGVILNVTIVNPQAPGYFTVWPWGTSQPTVSNVNFAAHETIANTVIVKASADGTISFYNGSRGDADILVDVEGYIAG